MVKALFWVGILNLCMSGVNWWFFYYGEPLYSNFPLFAACFAAFAALFCFVGWAASRREP